MWNTPTQMLAHIVSKAPTFERSYVCQIYSGNKITISSVKATQFETRPKPNQANEQ